MQNIACKAFLLEYFKNIYISLGNGPRMENRKSLNKNDQDHCFH